MKILTLAFSIIALLNFTACQPKESAPEQGVEPRTEAAPIQLFEKERAALEAAKGAEQIQQQQIEEQQKAIEQQTR